MTLPCRVGLVASKGRLPRRWLCGLRGHRWEQFDGCVRFKVGAEWRIAKGDDPISRCAFCEAREPWESNPIPPDDDGWHTVDNIAIARRLK